MKQEDNIFPKKAAFSRPASRRHEVQGVALVITLAILALLTIMLVSFVTVVSRDRSATQSYTQSLRAQEIAFGGLDKVVSQLRAEVTDPNNNSTIYGNGTSTTYMYVPKNTGAVPQRMMMNSALSPIVTESGSNIYYVSGTGTVMDLSSPSSASTNASLNSRSISISRWCKPQFLFPAVTNQFTSPSWVVVTRNGPAAFASGASPSAAGLTSLSLANMNAAVGRYAYVVYDTSGLMDINSAGYPSTAASSAPLKGGLPWADLTQLTNSSAQPNAISQNDVDTLVDWRNAASIANYTLYVTNAWSTNGYMRTAPGDTTFLSRQELIKYVQNQDPDLTNALPYLTTFSRELNGPTWGPTINAGGSVNEYGATYATATNYNYFQSSTTSTVTNPLIFIPRVETAFTRDNNTPAIVGEPLVKYRFPLDKLALLEKQGTVGLSPQDVADIQKYFGLDLVSDSNGLYRHWQYPTASTVYQHTAGTILTLSGVANLTTAREPDFFELLQAGILSGSLGRWGRGDNVGSNYHASAVLLDTDQSTTYQVIRIGANIIDQWDSDNYPTTITFSGTDFYGIEDLPYYSKALFKVIGTGGTATQMTVAQASDPGIPNPPYNFYLYFELWNPHQQSATDPNYPTKFRIAPLSGDAFHFGVGSYYAPVNYNYWYYNPNNVSAVPDSGFTGTFTQYFSSLAGGSGTITFSANQSSYREPLVIPASTTSPASAAVWSGGPNIAVIPMGAVPNFPTQTGTPASSPTGTTKQWTSIRTGASDACVANLLPPCTIVGFGAVFPLQYADAAGKWHTYSTFCGTTSSSITGYNDLVNTIPVAPTSSANASCFTKSDPRTYRFNAGVYMPVTANTSTYNSASYSLTPSPGVFSAPAFNHYFPFMGANSGPTNTTPYRTDMWSVNDPAVTPSGGYYNGSPSPNWAGEAAPYYLDNDGVQRVGDDRYAYAAGSSPYYTGDTAARPIILNRPFHSVGDLGYSFRDDPWKTLDLSSGNSADSALLDFFTMSDTPVVAGRVNPNTAPAPVLNALLSGAQANTSTITTSTSSITLAAAQAISTAITNQVFTTPFLNRAALVTSFMTSGTLTTAFPNGNKVEREAVIRGLAESANTRTWNFLIDIIGQSGNYPQTATTLDNFNVTGERRYWLHIAIDRYTGQIVDKQLEVVNE